MKEDLKCVCRWMSSPPQSIYRIAHWFTEIVQLLCIRSSFRGIAHISTEYPEVRAILFIGHLVLLRVGLEIFMREKGDIPGSW